MIVRETHLVPEGVGPVRLSEYVRTVFSLLPSRKGTDKAIKRGELRVDGERGSTGDWVRPGQVMELVDLQASVPKTYRLPLEIVFEDDDLVIVNKPPGIEVSGNKFKTVENALAGSLRPSEKPDTLPWARPVHRLDYSTSGLLMAAKTARAQVNLGQQFERRTVQKIYAAVVMGQPEPSGEISEDIGGVEALSRYTTVETVCSLRSGQLSLVQLIPATGRTHQLRIHMAAIGHPIVGDQKYGTAGDVLKGKGLFLAAVQLGFLHPVTQAKMSIKIDTPHKFSSLLQREQLRWEKFNG